MCDSHLASDSRASCDPANLSPSLSLAATAYLHILALKEGDATTF